MSTGAGCYFEEREPGQWYVHLQLWPYGEWPKYEHFGPFKDEAGCENEIQSNHANPGGWSVSRYKKKEKKA